MKKLPVGFASPLIVLVIGLLLGITVTLTVFHVFRTKIGDLETTPKNSTAVNVSSTSPLPSPTPDETANWKTYTNTKYGYTVRYPKEWLVFGGDSFQYNELCEENSTSKIHIEFTTEKITSCGHMDGEIDSSTQFAVYVFSNPATNPVDTLTKTEPIIISGNIKATKEYYTQKSQHPTAQATKIKFVHEGEGYTIYLKQKDNIGNYNPILDQILSTFQFIN